MMRNDYTKETAHEEIDYIFCDLFPRKGMTQRTEQIKLSHMMFDSMLEHRIALCDAGTGIGKTYAYLVAGIVYGRYRQFNDYCWMPVVISTSSITLQNAVLHDYLPFLSSLLMEANMTDQPIRGILRKGKSHYVCQDRLEHRLTQITKAKGRHKRQRILESLACDLDLDHADGLGSFDRSQVCVPAHCKCDRQQCGYKCFLQQAGRKDYLFQVCNHNLLLADMIHRDSERKPILPAGCCIIMDESHKLLDAARQMLGLSLTGDDLTDLLAELQQEGYEEFERFLRFSLRKLRSMLDQPPETHSLDEYAAVMPMPYCLLTEFMRQHLLAGSLRSRMQRIISVMDAVLCQQSLDDRVCYLAANDTGGTDLLVSTYRLDWELSRILWQQRKGMILTSGTLAVGTDFSRFRLESGLSNNGRVEEAVALSPFDYRSNCLLYLPRLPVHFPHSDHDADGYYDRLAGQIIELLEASSGHGLVLFTSYTMMEAVGERLRQENLLYPIYTLRKHQSSLLKQFRNHPGAVLLATGSAWEGMDFPGDQVSMLIIPRLPFGIPNELGERKRAEYETLKDYIQKEVVPEMQIKLRQGFGRAVRTETDTCVVAILDERCVPGKRYYKALRNALPDGIPETRELAEITEFMLDRKTNEYFREGTEYECKG